MSIEIKDLTFKYNPDTAFERVALKNINLTVESGEFFGLIGHTGSGKSTLIQHLNVLLKPTSGQIFLDGADINADKSKLKSIRRQVGLVFQYPEHQLFESTIYREIAFGPTMMGFTQEETKERVHHAAKTVGIDESMFEKSPLTVSGGQKRRIAIAGVLAMNPKVLVLDEPTAGLDPRGCAEIMDNIKKMHEELNLTVILVSHSMEDIARLANRIAVMDKGSIKYLGSPAEVFRKGEELEEIGLAAPQISGLIQKLNQKGFNLPKDIFTVEEATEYILKKLGQNP